MASQDSFKQSAEARKSDSPDRSSNVFGVPGSLTGSPPVSTGGSAAHHQAPILNSGSNQSWDSILEGLPFGLVVMGPQQEIVHENGFSRRVLGVGLAEQGGIEPWLQSLCPDPEHREKVITSWREHIWRNQLTRTYTLKGRDQKVREIEFRSSLLADGGITLTIQDVTETLRAEETLRHGKQKFRAVFTHSESGTVLVDRTGRILDANPAFLEMVEINQKELRLSTLADLLHPRDAEEFTNGARPDEGGTVTRQVWLRTRTSEKQARLIYCPIGETPDNPVLGIYIFTGTDRADRDLLEERLKLVTTKAQALLNSVPDLILLLEQDGTIVDFAPPQAQWESIRPDDSWMGSDAAEVFPGMGELLFRTREQVLEQGKTVHADLRSNEAEEPDFSVTLAPCGEGQALAVIRPLSLAPAEPAVAEPAAGDPSDVESVLRKEYGQHHFRNQIQLVTSLFSLEPQGAAARDAFLKWQVRLRAMAQACPYGNTDEIRTTALLRCLADEVCAVAGLGPGRREVIVRGPETVFLPASTASPFALLSGELMRLALCHRQPGPGAALSFDLREQDPQEMVVSVRLGRGRQFFYTDKESEVEILELLAEQFRGRLEPSRPGETPDGWEIFIPVR